MLRCARVCTECTQVTLRLAEKRSGFAGVAVSSTFNVSLGVSIETRERLSREPGQGRAGQGRAVIADLRAAQVKVDATWPKLTRGGPAEDHDLGFRA